MDPYPAAGFVRIDQPNVLLVIAPGWSVLLALLLLVPFLFLLWRMRKGSIFFSGQQKDLEAQQPQQPLLKNEVKFASMAVRQVMRHRSDISGIEYETPLSDVLRRVAELHYSRLPVYRGDLRSIVGILNTKDLLPYLQANDQFDWRQLLRTPLFVSASTRIEELLKEFQQKRIHFAVVVDEAETVCGIVTMEDIVEEVIGDVRDEFDEE